MNPSATGDGLLLNISKHDNAQNLDLAMSVIPFFRIKKGQAERIISEVVKCVRSWPKVAKKMDLPGREMELMRPAFRVAVG